MRRASATWRSASERGVEPDVYLRRQDGRPLDEVLDRVGARHGLLRGKVTWQAPGAPLERGARSSSALRSPYSPPTIWTLYRPGSRSVATRVARGAGASRRRPAAQSASPPPGT